MQQKGRLGSSARRLKNRRVPKVIVGIGLGQWILVSNVGRLQVSHDAPRRRLKHLIQIVSGLGLEVGQRGTRGLRTHRRGLVKFAAVLF